MLTKSIKLVVLISIMSLYSVAQASWWDFRKCNRTPLVQFDGTIAEAAIATPALSTLVTALSAADLVDTFNGEGNFTVFAPTNDAFGAIPGPILNEILADKDVLTAVLAYHVVARKVDPRRTWFVSRTNSLLGQKLFFSRSNGSPSINNSSASCQGVKTSNGIVWIIDSVLMPQFR